MYVKLHCHDNVTRPRKTGLITPLAINILMFGNALTVAYFNISNILTVTNTVAVI